MRADVAVVGAGPAGSAAAVELARAGLDVVVVDRARFPRDKTCGDGLTTAALRALEDLGLRPEAVPSWQEVTGVWLRSPSGRTAHFPLPEGQGRFAAVARRADLDAALVDLARAAGAKVHDGHALVGARDDGDEVVLDVAGLGEVRARYAVGADGMWSPLRKALGAAEPGYLGEWHAFRQYLRTPGPDPGPHASEEPGVGPPGGSTTMWVWFDEDLLPGYAWSFPLPGGQANVGFGIRRRPGQPVGHAMKALWADLLARPHVRAVLGEGAEPEAPHTAWPIPARVDRATLAVGRALFAGDAARAVDPLTGEGIAQALETGRLAARAVVASGPRHADAARLRYERAVRRALVADHRLSVALGEVLRRPPGARAAVRAAALTPWTRRSFARWLFEDEPRAAALTPRRWHRHFLARPGAFRSGREIGRQDDRTRGQND